MYPVDDLFAAYARGFDANREAEMTLAYNDFARRLAVGEYPPIPDSGEVAD